MAISLDTYDDCFTIPEILKKYPKGLFYLASPYSNKDPKIQDQNAIDIDDIAAILIKRGLALIEPITMCHNKAKKHKFPHGFEYWKDRDLNYIDHCDAVLVIRMNNWKESRGVQAEIQHALSTKKSVYYLDVDYYDIEPEPGEWFDESFFEAHKEYAALQANITFDKLLESGSLVTVKKDPMNDAPLEILEVFSGMCQVGINKGYKANTWLTDFSVGQHLEALKRHIRDYERGIAIDQDGFKNLHAILWRASAACMVDYFGLQPKHEPWLGKILKKKEK